MSEEEPKSPKGDFDIPHPIEGAQLRGQVAWMYFEEDGSFFRANRSSNPLIFFREPTKKDLYNTRWRYSKKLEYKRVLVVTEV